MKQPFGRYYPTTESPAIGCFSITPNDGVDLESEIRAVTINGSGTISYIGRDGLTYTSGILPVGTYPFFATRILATSTTATDITGWI